MSPRFLGRSERLEVAGRITRDTVDPGRWAGSTEPWFISAVATGVDFSGMRLDSFVAEKTDFRGCDFRRVSFEAGGFAVEKQSVYRSCRFDGADLRHIFLGQARFEDCTFDNAKIHDWAADAAEFVRCHFAGRITMSRFSGRPWGMWEDPGALDPPRTFNEFIGNDFRQAELLDCSFVRGIDVSSQMWPEGDEYIRLDHLHDRIDLARAQVLRWPDSPAREDALILLDVYSEAGYEDQPELFTHKWSLKLNREATARVWDLLLGVRPTHK